MVPAVRSGRDPATLPPSGGRGARGPVGGDRRMTGEGGSGREPNQVPGGAGAGARRARTTPTSSPRTRGHSPQRRSPSRASPPRPAPARSAPARRSAGSGSPRRPAGPARNRRTGRPPASPPRVRSAVRQGHPPDGHRSRERGRSRRRHRVGRRPRGCRAQWWAGRHRVRSGDDADSAGATGCASGCSERDAASADPARTTATAAARVAATSNDRRRGPRLRCRGVPPSRNGARSWCRPSRCRSAGGSLRTGRRPAGCRAGAGRRPAGGRGRPGRAPVVARRQGSLSIVGGAIGGLLEHSIVRAASVRSV